jgi:hypothetical protein
VRLGEQRLDRLDGYLRAQIPTWSLHPLVQNLSALRGFDTIAGAGLAATATTRRNELQRHPTIALHRQVHQRPGISTRQFGIRHCNPGICSSQYLLHDIQRFIRVLRIWEYIITISILSSRICVQKNALTTPSFYVTECHRAPKQGADAQSSWWVPLRQCAPSGEPTVTSI